MRRATCKTICRYLAAACYLLVVIFTARQMLRDPCVDTIPFPNASPREHTATWASRQAQVFEGAEEIAVEARGAGHERIDWTETRPLQTFPDHDEMSVLSGTPPKAICPSIHRYNHCVSETIPYNRSLVDTRNRRCERRPYLRALPRVSLVLTSAASEHPSVILRGLYGIHRRTPAQLVRQAMLILVTKGSDTEKELRATEAAILSRFPALTLVRSAPDQGLLGARRQGVERSSAEVIAFFHLPAEVNVNWLPPLLEPIAMNPRVVTTPVLDVISRTTFEYGPVGPTDGNRTAFNWRLEDELFGRGHVENTSRHLPFATAVADNRAFVISRVQWTDIEGYNPGLNPLGGGEHIELSVKTWLCGGEVKAVPCSRIGVIPKRSSSTFDDVENYALVARHWMDEFSEFVLAEIGEQTGAGGTEPSAVRALKDRLICKPFRWFLEKVLPELITLYPPYRQGQDLGQIQSVECGLCASITEKNMKKKDSVISLRTCPDPRRHEPPSLHLMGDGRLQLAESRVCLALNGRGWAMYETCSSVSPNQLWEYDHTTRRVTHLVTKRCLKSTVTCSMAAFPKFYVGDKFSNSTKWQWQVAARLSDLLPLPSTTAATTPAQNLSSSSS